MFWIVIQIIRTLLKWFKMSIYIHSKICFQCQNNQQKDNIRSDLKHNFVGHSFVFYLPDIYFDAGKCVTVTVCCGSHRSDYTLISRSSGNSSTCKLWYNLWAWFSKCFWYKQTMGNTPQGHQWKKTLCHLFLIGCASKCLSDAGLQDVWEAFHAKTLQVRRHKHTYFW